MDLQLDPSIAAGYKSSSQIARVVTEQWASDNLYCLACTYDALDSLSGNAPVTDYHCPSCKSRYQLKSQRGRFGRAVTNSAYGPKMQAIEQGLAPHYAFLQYSRDTWRVTDLFVVPGYFFTPAVIEKRPPLKKPARRAGWVGSNIVLRGLAPEARVALISDGQIRPPAEARDAWQKFAFLGAAPEARGGWGADVLTCVHTLVSELRGAEFTLQQFYARFEAELQARHPDNHNVQAKIRQQMQVLRDGGVLDFDGKGRYRIRG